MPHAPPEQVALPLVVSHTLPHEPQLEVFALVPVSHPFATLLSQLPYPDEHEMVQAPATQEGVPLFVLQALVHVPQFEVVERFVSQPLPTSPSQLPQPDAQAIWQAPPTQEGVPLFALHALPHAPQLAVVARFVSQPFAVFPSQLPTPGLHVIPLHTPPLHSGVPPAELQTFPHVPQLLVVVTSVSQPLFALLSQLPQPALHEI